MDASHRLASIAVATAMAAALIPAPGASAAPAAPTPPPVSVTPKAPERGSGAESAELPDAGVASAYERWRSGSYRPEKGVDEDTLRVQIENTSSSKTAALARDLGAQNVQTVTESVVVADVPFNKLDELQEASLTTSVTIPPTINVVPDETSAFLASSTTASAAKGSNGAEIIAKTNAAAWHKAGLNGSGVKIGLIDVFDRAAWNAAIAAGELDSAKLGGTFCRNNGLNCDLWSSGEVHGVAVAEIVRDMAPGATLYLASANTLADTKAAIDYLASKGVKIVSRSLTSPYDGPGNGTGPSAELLNYAVGKGIAWFNSAGNAGSHIATDTYSNQQFSVGGYWRGTWLDTDGDGWLEFTDPAGLTVPSEYMPVRCGFFNGLRWNDWGESDRSDYDLYAFGDPLHPESTLIARSEADQTKGADPLEGVLGSTTKGNFNAIDCGSDNLAQFGDYSVYYVSIRRHSPGKDTKDVLEILVNTDLLYYASSPSSTGHPFADSKNPGAASVGAVDPVAGATIGSYSSQGPTNDGRVKPDLSAGAGFSSYTYRAAGGFSGTSAAAPVAAGAAALVLQSAPSLSPAQLLKYVRQSAVADRGTAGLDSVYGSGEVQLGKVVAFTTTATPPTLSGTPKVGATLKAAPPADWAPTGATYTYAWFANGAAITRTSGASLTLTAAELGKKITVQVKSARKAGYFPSAGSSKLSTATAAVAHGSLTAPTPKITGTLAVGKKATAQRGTWTKGTTFTYQWYANGKAIKGATKSTFKLTKSQRGKRLSVKVTGKLTGYTTASKTSAATSKVLTSATPKITGTKRIGKTLKVSKGTWTKKTTFSYQWYANGAAIKGATKSSLKLTKAQLGKTVTVKLTGKKSGYATVALTSKKTSKIKR